LLIVSAGRLSGRFKTSDQENFCILFKKTERISALDRHGASEDISKTAISEDT
jgi:hypothetical protein